MVHPAFQKKEPMRQKFIAVAVLYDLHGASEQIDHHMKRCGPIRVHHLPKRNTVVCLAYKGHGITWNFKRVSFHRFLLPEIKILPAKNTAHISPFAKK